jgi:tRNA pseudouridine38-40 synthase
MTSRWKCLCAYDGSRFEGWQSQPGGRGIQDVIEARLAVIFKGPVRIHGSGRTDSGVHARGQVFHFDAEWSHGAEKLGRALRSGLDPAIQIRSIRSAPGSFHARFSAKGKVYRYLVVEGDADPFTRPFCWMVDPGLDRSRMRQAAKILEGTHDFAAFSAENGTETDPEGPGTVRTLTRLHLSGAGRRLTITAEADGFLYKMVRRLVGALVGVGRGKLTPDDIRALLAAGTRSARVQTAPPQGLVMERVLYR